MHLHLGLLKVMTYALVEVDSKVFVDVTQLEVFNHTKKFEPFIEYADDIIPLQQHLQAH